MMLMTMVSTTIATLLLGLAAFITFTRGADVNVALDKSYSQSSVASSQQSVEAASNGDTIAEYPDNCMRSQKDDKDHPWYEVDLERVHPVYDIDIWARTDYQDKLYPSTITVDGETCARIPSSWSGRKHSVTCSEVMYGQRVRLTLDRETWLCMCEIQIWVPEGVSRCPVGKHGPSCDSDCSDHCGEGPGKNFCDQETAHCYDDCDGGWFGQECAAGCGHCANDETCDPETGMCTEGCKDGWKSELCEEECDTGTWGPACGNTCGRCKGEAVCDKSTGHCPICQPGWHPPDCGTACNDGTYGDHCTKLCGSCLNDVICSKINGHCPACAPGKKPPLCATAKKKDKTNAGVVAGSVVAVLVVLGIIVIVIIFVLRRRGQTLYACCRRRCQTRQESTELQNECPPEYTAGSTEEPTKESNA